MNFRLKQVRMAILLAIGFVCLRLVYAIVFGGAGSSGSVLFALPEIQLSGSFRHITLFGAVTTTGLIQNFLTAMPFALLILGFGFASSLINPKKLFEMAAKSRWFSNAYLALAIGWAQLPALSESAKRIRLALKLRDEKGHRLLIPILETAASRALAIATRLLVQNSKRAEMPLIQTEGVSVGKVTVADFSAKAGQLIVITGPTASGKSRILQAFAGLAPELGVKVQGVLTVQGSIGYLPQQPRDSIWGPLVSDEIVDVAAINLLANQEVQYLSEGEAVKLVLQRELERGPQLLLLDEPFASLDSSAAAEFTSRISDFVARGGLAIVVEHRPEFLESLEPIWLQVHAGQLLPGRYRPPQGDVERFNPVVGNDQLFEFSFDSLEVAGRVLATGILLQVHQSQAIAISGVNGSGKTSLLKRIAQTGTVDVIAMVPEVVTDFFVMLSLEDELARADKLSGQKPGFTKSSFLSICPNLKIDLDTHPRDLSHGTQLALAIAMQLSHKPKLLLIDEPVKGFDLLTRHRVAQTLKCVLETGTAVIFATHDQVFANELAHTQFLIANQRFVPVSQVLR
jgi:energy-coupling factor transporter ATP-binding protein EcfA2